MLSSVEQAFVGRDEKRAPLKTPAWKATQGLIKECSRKTYVRAQRNYNSTALKNQPADAAVAVSLKKNAELV